MNKVILCEGKTDAILLSYYLGKCFNWKYTSQFPENLRIKAQKDNESVNCYKRGEDYLLICAVGGKDNFGRFFEEKLRRSLEISNSIEKIVVITDKDDRTVSDIESFFIEDFKGCFSKIINRKWSSNSYTDEFKKKMSVEVLLVVIPKNHAGALETVLLDAISENPYDKNIVEKTRTFVEQMRGEAAQYISTDRLQMKAHLGVTWAVQYPEKVFSLIDEQMRSISWEKYEVLNECYGILGEI